MLADSDDLGPATCLVGSGHVLGFLPLTAGKTGLYSAECLAEFSVLQSERGCGDAVSSVSQSGDGKDWESRVSAVRARVRRDRRATSLPLLFLGVATAVGVAPQLSSGTGDALAGLMITLAFAAIWAVFRFRAARAGVGRGTGFGVASLLGLFLMLTIVGLVALVYAGPFLIFGVGLLVAAVWQRNAFLAAWAVVIGGIGIFEGFFGITNRLPMSLWAQWEHPAIYLILALMTILAGIAAWLRENHAT